MFILPSHMSHCSQIAIVAWAAVYVLYSGIFGKLSVDALSTDNFGPAKPRVKYMHICKGPKRRDCTNSTVTVHGDYSNITLRTRLLSPNLAIYKIRSSIWELKNNTVPGVADIVRNVDNPCNNFFFGPFFKAIAKFSDKCVLDKSLYELNLNVTNLLENFLGDYFFYGHFKVKTIVMAKQCNVICCVSEFSLEPTTTAGPKKPKQLPLFH